MNLKNRCLLYFVKWFKKKPTVNNRILVVATTALGDTLWATPALESLRKSFPTSYIAVLTSPIGEQVLRHNPWTDTIHVLSEPLFYQFFSLRKKLGSFSDILILHASQRLILPLCATLGARKIVGTSGINKGLDELLTDGIANTNEHEIARRLQLIEKIGAQRHTETLSYFIQKEERLSRPKLKKLVALHPGSKDGFKRWPASHFVAVGKELESLGCEILISGTAEEASLTKMIAEQIPGATVSDPSLSLRSFAALLQNVDLLISNDTGPVHLACAIGAPVIALYSATNPKLCGPHKTTKAITLYKPPTCNPCYKRKCRDPFCLQQISPLEVVQCAKNLLF